MPQGAVQELGLAVRLVMLRRCDDIADTRDAARL